jgi:regulator of chromosome condensation
LHDVVVIGAGNYHGFAVKKDGKVYAWGVNTHGQCGLDETYGDVVASPTVVPELGPDAHDGAKVVSITGVSCGK